MTTTEAAARLGLTKRAVSGLCKRNVINARKVGRDWWIDETEVELFVNISKRDSRGMVLDHLHQQFFAARLRVLF